MSILTENVSPHNFVNEEIARYSRHLILPEVTLIGQTKLKSAKVLIIGTGGLGSPLAMYLASAGVGTLGLVDFDIVDVSNLQRQIIHSTADIGTSKLHSARNTIKSLNPFVEVILHETTLDSSNALEIINDYDIIVDCTDNFPTRYLTNDASVFLDKPYVYGSIFRFEGQVSVFNYENGPCYRCLYENPPPPGVVPSCAEGGVLGVLPGIIGTIQATEVIKLIIEEGNPLSGRLLLLDALDMEFQTLKLQKNPNCVVCGPNPIVTELIDYNEFCGLGGSLPIFDNNLSISIKEFNELQENGEDFQLIDVREPHEQLISKIEGSILIPKNEIENSLDLIDREKLTIIHCKTGIRSGKVVNKLVKLGYNNVKNLVGGINSYADLVGVDIPKY